jgi:simple sugar transport system ATP-binding protein
MCGVTKRFGPVLANDAVDLDVAQGEIHAIVGENGAGKTTLMRILAGIHQPDVGEIRLRGQLIQLTNTRLAREHGIGMVHQHFSLVPSLTVAENVLLTALPSTGGLFRKVRAEALVRGLGREYGLEVDPRMRVEECSVGLRQRVEILKALYGGTEILILDEPTAVLTPQETEKLLATLRGFRDKGKTILFITHKLKEVMSGADRVTVMRGGQAMPARPVSHTTVPELADAMVGRTVRLGLDKPVRRPGATVLALDHVWLQGDRGDWALRGVSLEVRVGEVVGIAGVEGNGQSELAEVVTGLRRVQRGGVRIEGTDVTHRLSPATARTKGVAHIPEDRLRRGIASAATVRDNLIMGHHREPPIARRGWLDHAAIDAFARRLVESNDIRPGNIAAAAESLSGGNIQKAVIARELSGRPSLIVAAQPTRGVDIGASEFICAQLLAHLDRAGILLISSDLDEILRTADRVLVMFKGQIIGGGDSRKFSVNDLGLLMAGIDPSSHVTHTADTRHGDG